MADQIDIIMADLDLYTRGELIALALNVDANLKEASPLGTPVDTGWARANWVPSVGELALLPDKKDPSPADIVARTELGNQGRNDLLSYKLTDGPIFVANNVAYIQALNNGHSQKSPAGFVQNAIEVAVRQTISSGANKAARLRAAERVKTVANKKAGSTRGTALARARDRRGGPSAGIVTTSKRPNK